MRSFLVPEVAICTAGEGYLVTGRADALYWGAVGAPSRSATFPSTDVAEPLEGTLSGDTAVGAADGRAP